MKQRVVPRMSPIFAQRDPERFAEIGCRTCHGKQADEGQFDMPSTDLPTLDLDDLHTWKPRDLAWMRNEVEPTMAALLSRTQGFGCGNCHITK